MWEGPQSPQVGRVKERLLEGKDVNLEILHALNWLITHKRNVLFVLTFLTCSVCFSSYLHLGR